MDVSILHSFSLLLGFAPLGFTGKVFNEAVLTNFLKFHNGLSRGSVTRKYVNDNQFIKGILVIFVK